MVETLRSESTNVDECIEVCKLVVSAAAKLTIQTHQIKEDFEAVITLADVNSQAVGRLHNAARKARAALPADVVAAIEAKAAEDCNA